MSKEKMMLDRQVDMGPNKTWFAYHQVSTCGADSFMPQNVLDAPFDLYTFSNLK